MLKSQAFYRLLRRCAWLVEQVLPVKWYHPLYVRLRRFYDVRILNQPSIIPVTRYEVPVQKEPVQVVPEEPEKPAEIEWTLFVNKKGVARLSRPFVRCGGEPLAPGSEEVEVRDFLAPVRERCGMVICCAFRGRHEVLERVITESFHARGGKDVRWLLTGSTDEDYRFIETMAARTGRVAGLVCENKPLGRKWQTCVQHAYHYYDAAIYAITGSDDILSSKLIDHIFTAHGNNMELSEDFVPDLYCANEWLVHSSVKKYSPMVLKCAYGYETVFQPLGAGRFYSRKFMDGVDGILFDSSLKRCLDDYGYFKVRDRGDKIEFFTVEDGPILSVKGEWEQLNSLDVFFQATTLDIDEFAFEGYRLLRESLHPDTFNHLFKPTDLGFQIFD